MYPLQESGFYDLLPELTGIYRSSNHPDHQKTWHVLDKQKHRPVSDLPGRGGYKRYIYQYNRRGVQNVRHKDRTRHKLYSLYVYWWIQEQFHHHCSDLLR